jgi:hypothetical protein
MRGDEMRSRKDDRQKSPTKHRKGARTYEGQYSGLELRRDILLQLGYLGTKLLYSWQS